MIQASTYLIAIALFLCGASLGADEIAFSNRAELEAAVSDNGTVSLAWNKPEGTVVELQQSADEHFSAPVSRYTGRDPGSVLTGLPEGVHYFRLTAAGSGQWTPPLRITVAFVPRWKLALLLSLGGCVVAATIATIVAGHFSTRKRTDHG